MTQVSLRGVVEGAEDAKTHVVDLLAVDRTSLPPHGCRTSEPPYAGHHAPFDILVQSSDHCDLVPVAQPVLTAPSFSRHSSRVDDAFLPFALVRRLLDQVVGGAQPLLSHDCFFANDDRLPRFVGHCSAIGVEGASEGAVRDVVGRAVGTRNSSGSLGRGREGLCCWPRVGVGWCWWHGETRVLNE